MTKTTKPTLRAPATGPIKYYKFRGALLTASEIARRHGLSLPTVMRRLRAGLPDEQVVAAPHTIPRGIASQYHSDRPMTPPKARFHMERALKHCDRCREHYESAMRRGEPDDVLARLRVAYDKSTMTASYWRERLRMAITRAENDQDASRMAKLRILRSRTKPDETTSSEPTTNEGE